MSHIWPAETVFDEVDLFLHGLRCGHCQTEVRMLGHRHRRVFTLDGPQLLIIRVGHCPAPECRGHSESVSSWNEMAIAPPRLTVAWDVFAWIGHRRCARHWSVPQIRDELADSYRIDLSEDAIEDYIRRYQVMVAARQSDPKELRKVYAEKKPLVLSIDGLQPEKGHETLYVVRELTQKRVWFAEPLRSSTNDEVQRLLERAKAIAASLDCPVAGWISDKQDAFVQGIAAVFPGTPHGYCQNHFLRDLAKPMLEADSHAKVQMRRKVRGLRAIERAVLREKTREIAIETAMTGVTPGNSAEPSLLDEMAVVETTTVTVDHMTVDYQGAVDAPPTPFPEPSVSQPSEAGQVVLDYCSAVRGILNDDQGGPLHPPGLRMANALADVRRSLQVCVKEKKKVVRKHCSNG